jgi:hypothetical protein
MIAKGKIRRQGAKLARYLETGEPGETAKLVETRGLEDFGCNPVTAFQRLEQWADDNSKCKKAFFHGHIRLAPGERLTDVQWMNAVDRMEKTLGFTGQPRMVSFHIDEATGEKHLHVAWFRIDLETGRAIDPGLYKNKLKHLSRDLEKKFGLQIVSNERKAGDRAKAADRNEFEESRRLGTDLKAIRNAILDCLEKSDGGRAFDAAIRERGGIVANGERGFVVIDPAGGHHALNKRLTGMTLAEIRTRFADLDPAHLPTVDQAIAFQLERKAAREAAQAQKMAAAPQRDLTTNAPAHISSTVPAPEQPSLGLPRKYRPESEDMDEDIAAQQRQQRQQIEDREAARYNDMVGERNRADRFIRDWQLSHDYGERNKRKLQQDEWQRAAEGDIVDVRVRALIAAGESRDFVQAVRREGALISEEHSELNRDIALEKDPDRKQALTLKRDIEHADYMALANERIAAMSNLNSEQYKEAQRQQEEWSKIGTDLRKERLEHQERMAEKSAQDITADVERRRQADSINDADRQRAEHRTDIRGNPETPHAPVQAHEAAEGVTAGATAETRTTEPQRPAEVIYVGPTPRQRDESATVENTDARQSTTAEHVEITDSKAAKKAALAQLRAETEEAIQRGQERGYGHSR